MHPFCSSQMIAKICSTILHFLFNYHTLPVTLFKENLLWFLLGYLGIDILFMLKYFSYDFKYLLNDIWKLYFILFPSSMTSWLISVASLTSFICLTFRNPFITLNSLTSFAWPTSQTSLTSFLSDLPDILEHHDILDLLDLLGPPWSPWHLWPP